MDNDELKRIIFQSHGQDLRALKFMQAQIATLTAKLERVRAIAEGMRRAAAFENNVLAGNSSTRILKELGDD